MSFKFKLKKKSIRYKKYKYLHNKNKNKILNHIKLIFFSLFFCLYKKKSEVCRFKLFFYNFFAFDFFVLNFKLVEKLKDFFFVDVKDFENFNKFFSFLIFFTFSFSKNRFNIIRKFFKKRKYFFNFFYSRKIGKIKKNCAKLVRWKRKPDFEFDYFSYNWRFVCSFRKGFFFFVPIVEFFVNFFSFLYLKNIYLLKYTKLFFKSLEKRNKYGIYLNLNLNLNKFFLTTYLKNGNYLKNFVNLQSLNDKLLFFLKNKVKLIEKINFFFFMFHIKYKLVRRLVGKKFFEIMKSVGKQKEQSKLLLQFLFSEYYTGSKFFENIALFFLNYRFENFIGTYRKKYLKKFNRGNCKYIFSSKNRKRYNKHARKRFGW